MIQIVIPMAGLGSRFKSEGYSVPKPLLPIHGQEMYKVVLANLFSKDVSRVVLITPREFELSPLASRLTESLGIEVIVVEVDSVTKGAAMSVLLARDFLDENAPVVTANSDQYVDFDARGFYAKLQNQEEVGLVLTMQDSDPKWSFARVDERGKILEIREKEPISSNATVGIYGFKRASALFDAIDKMVLADDMANGEFYVAPAYFYIEGFENPGVAIWDLGPVGQVMFGMGVPDDYEHFLTLPVSAKAARDSRSLFEASN